VVEAILRDVYTFFQAQLIYVDVRVLPKVIEHVAQQPILYFKPVRPIIISIIGIVNKIATEFMGTG
jgi:hypothetical protein